MIVPTSAVLRLAAALYKAYDAMAVGDLAAVLLALDEIKVVLDAVVAENPEHENYVS